MRTMGVKLALIPISLLLIVSCRSKEYLWTEGRPFYGMRVDSIVGTSDEYEVTTTGATYKINRSFVDLTRRISPKTNKINPKLVAQIAFQDIGPLKIEHADSESCVINSEQLKFTIYSDSAMVINRSDHPNSLSSFSYTYNNTLVDAPHKVGPDTERFWTDGYGGSLHARNPAAKGSYAKENITEDSFRITLDNISSSIVAVFPPKKFDFEALYGTNARPHVCFVGSKKNLDKAIERMDMLKSKGFGVILLFAGLYSGIESGLVIKDESPIYDTRENGSRYNYRYEWADPQYIRDSIAKLHAEGFKVITYVSGYRWSLVTKKENTLAFLRKFRDEYNLDGWYFDNASAGGKNWFASYEFMKQARRDLGDDGIIYHHNSVDIWAELARDGRTFIPIDAYANYTLKGETGAWAQEIHSPNHPYLRYYTCQYGFSQAIGAHILATFGNPSFMRNDLRRLMAQNFNGSSRLAFYYLLEKAWYNYYEPAYLKRKAEYLSGDFSPDSMPVDWWFEATDVSVQPSHDSATVSWKTHMPADSLVREALMDQSRRVKGGVSSKELVLDHSLTLPNLTPNTEYRFNVRSSDGYNVWGNHGTFKTLSNDEN